MSGTVDADVPSGRVITGQFHRVQHRHGKRFVSEPPPQVAPVYQPARVAIMLALAHKIQSAIEAEQAHDRADVARRLNFSRARITQLMNLTLLAPDLQEQIFLLEAVDGKQPPLNERALRRVVGARSWERQRALWAELCTPSATALTPD